MTEVMTGEEVLTALRINVANPARKLMHLRNRKRNPLPHIKLGRDFTYPRAAFDTWLAKETLHAN